MLTLLLAFATATSLVGWYRSYRSHRKQRAFSDRSGRLAEFVIEFRDFVRSVEGTVPEDVEQALRYLEATDARGTLNAKQPDAPLLVAPGSRLPIASQKQWEVICSDLRVTPYEQQLDVLKEWAARYSFTTKMRVEVMRLISYEEQPQARKLMQIVD